METQLTERLRTLTVSDQATLYGCCGLFDPCADDALMALSFAGQDPFLDWIGWEASQECEIRRNFLAWVRPEYSGGVPTPGYLADPCSAGYGVEWGTCDFLLRDFGLLRRHSPVRDITKAGLKRCQIEPRYRLDGSPITDDIEYDMRIATEVLLQDLKRRVIVGNAATPHDFSGLENLVKTGYTSSDGTHCQMLDSIVINWAGNDLGGGNGITWNGNPVSNTYDFVSVLLAAFRRVLQRISWAPSLAAQRLQVGNIVLVAPTHLIRCILDSYTCWSVCPGSQNVTVSLQTYEARQFRNQLNGGMFGAGRIWLDGFEVPLIAYDWGLTKGTLSDCYLLTNAVGNVRLIQGQYNDMNAAAQLQPETFKATDGGRILTWGEGERTCWRRYVEMQPRILMWAPWAQVRFQNIKCTQPGGVISPDPIETSFFPQTSFVLAECPES